MSRASSFYCSAQNKADSALDADHFDPGPNQSYKTHPAQTTHSMTTTDHHARMDLEVGSSDANTVNEPEAKLEEKDTERVCRWGSDHYYGVSLRSMSLEKVVIWQVRSVSCCEYWRRGAVLCSGQSLRQVGKLPVRWLPAPESTKDLVRHLLVLRVRRASAAE
jgi:hypothetical protein